MKAGEKLKRRKVKVTRPRTPRTRKPKDMSLEEWQIALRREYGREQDFRFEKVGDEPFFSDYLVTNPKSGGRYRVAIRGSEIGANFCSCPDFQVNTLGTCKHIEWLLAKLERKRGGKKAFREGFHPPYSEIYLHHGMTRRVRFRAGTSCPATLHAKAMKYFDEEGFLRDAAAGRFERFVRETSKSDHEVRIYEDALALVARLRDDARRIKAIETRFGNGKAKPALAKLVKTKLYPYQQEGALFAAKAGRCLLADDMGLGKTVQSIAAVEILARTAGVERVLVVCPTALKQQWKQEVERFTDRDAQVVEGLRLGREACYREETFYKITNYDVVHRDMDFIDGWRPDVVILDEAQRIKNWKTRRAQAVKRIASEYAIVLTGTPLENRLEELHSIMEFVDRFHLGPLFRFLAEHQVVDAHGKVEGYTNLDQIKESLAPVLVRRHKRDVLTQLPERTDKHYFVDMTPEQQVLHEENRELVARIVAKWRRWGFLSEKDQRMLMVGLQNMRMSCNSTFLLDKESDHSTKLDECSVLLDDILEVPGNKVVIFSQWLGTHRLLIRRLEPLKRAYAFYHGSLDGKARKKVIERFKTDPDCRILLCSDSGGVGLNLQEASAVINMDQPWNPAVLEQRIGRVHRLGQKRNVQVYHFVSRDSIEYGMLGVLKFKSSLFAGVLDGGESEVFLGGSKMKKFMETVEKVSENTPEVPLERVTTAELEKEGVLADDDGDTKAEAAAPDAGVAAAGAAPAWDGVIAAGVAFLGQLGKAMEGAGGKAGKASSARGLGGLVQRNRETGGQELRIPLPEGDAAAQLGELLAGLGGLLKGMGKK